MKSEQGYSLLKKGSSYTPPFHLLFESHFFKGFEESDTPLHQTPVI